MAVVVTAITAVGGLLAGCTSEDPASRGADDAGAAEPATTAPGDPDEDEAEAASRAVFERAGVGAEGAPGCAAGVSLDGEVVFAEGFGVTDVDDPTPLGPETRFDIASVSKSLTAATVLVLVENGVVALDEGVRTWLPELPETWDDVTIEHLLHHTSGVPPYEDALAAEVSELEPTTADDALAVLVGQPDLRFPPGTAWEYSNSGYFLLSLIVARATGAEFADVVRSQVLEPLGLDATFVRSDWSVPVEGGSRGHADLGEGGLERYESPWAQQGDGAVQSTVLDLLVWADELRTADVLGADLQRAMQTPVVLDDGTAEEYGAGLVLGEDDEGRRFVGHEGAWVGFTSALVVLPDEGVAAAVLCNVDDAPVTELADELVEVWLAT